MGRRRALFASAAFLTASVFTTDAQEEDSGSGSGDSEGSSNPLTPLLVSVIALIAAFAVVIVVLTVAIVIMCRRLSSRRVYVRSKVDTNTYRGFSRERTQSPPESTVIHDPLSRPMASSRSTRSHSSHLPTSPLSPAPLQSTSSPANHHPRSLSTSALDAHTYNHLRQHEGMEPLPLDYPLHEYSRLGPRPETPPLRPPKPAHMKPHPVEQEASAVPQSDANPPVSATNPAPSIGSNQSPSVAAGEDVGSLGEEVGSCQDPGRGADEDSGRGGGGGGGGGREGSDEVFARRSIYDTMTSEGLLMRRGETDTTQGTAGQPPSSDAHLGNRDYDKLVQHTSPPPTTVGVTSSSPPQSGVRKQRKSSVKIFDDPTYSPPPDQSSPTTTTGRGEAVVASSRARSTSVKVLDPRYAGNYERHPDFVPPEIEIPRDQLQEKYRGDYERDPTYFSRNPTRSFSVSAASSVGVSRGGRSREHHSSLTMELAVVADKYRGDYERSEDYVIPPQRPVQNKHSETGTEDYVLETDPSYVGAYERHPDYVPPLIKRSSKTKIQILSTEAVTSNGGPSVVAGRPSHLPHEYMSLAAVTKDPPRQYATLNPDLSTTHTLPTGSLKDSMV